MADRFGLDLSIPGDRPYFPRLPLSLAPPATFLLPPPQIIKARSLFGGKINTRTMSDAFFGGWGPQDVVGEGGAGLDAH